MTNDPDMTATNLQRLLTQASERQDAEYKSSLPFVGNDSFSLKLVKHIFGMANTGGGWTAIGFSDETSRTWCNSG